MVLQRYMDAIEQADDGALAAARGRAGQPAAGSRRSHRAGAGLVSGRETIVDAWAPALHGPGAVEIRLVPTRANRQPAVGTYVRVAGGSKYRAFGLAVLRVEDGAVAEVTVFVPDLFPAFGLPLTRR